jgi:hypothetical protein
MNTRTRIALGSGLSTFGALAIVLSVLFEWAVAPRPWGFLWGFFTGVVAGLGVTLAISGLLDRRRGIS